jgi:hypothetical protein
LKWRLELRDESWTGDQCVEPAGVLRLKGGGWCESKKPQGREQVIPHLEEHWGFRSHGTLLHSLPNAGRGCFGAWNIQLTKLAFVLPLVPLPPCYSFCSSNAPWTFFPVPSESKSTTNYENSAGRIL